MFWDQRRFEVCINKVRLSLQGRQTPLGVPFFVYVYNPEAEISCIRNFENLAEQFRNEGFHIQVIYLGKVLTYALRKTPYLDIAAEIEKTKRLELIEELSQYLPEIIAEILLNGGNGLIEPLKGGNQQKGAFLLRSGALFPFVHVSQILAYIEGKTNWTVVIPFPGSRNPKHPERLRFLNETEGKYYRATVI